MGSQNFPLSCLGQSTNIKLQGLSKSGDDYDVKAAHVELAERMRKVVSALFYFVLIL